MIFKTYALYKVLCEHCFLTLQPLNRRRKKFFISALCLFLSIKGKINFLQLERYGENCEQTSHNQFQAGFEFLPFNATLVSQYCSTRTVMPLPLPICPNRAKKPKGLADSGRVVPVHLSGVWKSAV